MTSVLQHGPEGYGSQIVRWAIFSVAVPLVPFGLLALTYLKQNAPAFKVYGLWPHGELIIAAGLVAITSISDIATPRFRVSGASLLMGAGAVAIFVMTSVLFMLLQGVGAGDFNPRTVNRLSAFVFCAAAGVSLMCKMFVVMVEKKVASQEGTPA